VGQSAMSEGAKRKTDGEDPIEKKKKKKKKPKGQNSGTLSFADEEGEEDGEAFVQKVKRNPAVGGLVKTEWMSKEAQAQLAQEEAERQAVATKEREKAEARPLVLHFIAILAPLDDTGGDSHPPRFGKPPRRYKPLDFPIKITYGHTIKMFYDEVKALLLGRQDQQYQRYHSSAPAVSGVMVQSGLLMCAVGNYMVQEDMKFIDLEAAKYDDGSLMFDLENVFDPEKPATSDIYVLERVYYEFCKFHFPMNQWDIFDFKVSYKNPAKTSQFKANGSELMEAEWRKSQGMEEEFHYKSSKGGCPIFKGRIQK